MKKYVLAVVLVILVLVASPLVRRKTRRKLLRPVGVNPKACPKLQKTITPLRVQVVFTRIRRRQEKSAACPTLFL